MGWFTSEKSWSNVTREQARQHRADHGTRRGESWTKQANRQAKERKAALKAEAERKKQDRKDINARKRHPLKTTPTWGGLARGANAKTIAAAEKKREKKAAKKAERKAKGFWG